MTEQEKNAQLNALQAKYNQAGKKAIRKYKVAIKNGLKSVSLTRVHHGLWVMWTGEKFVMFDYHAYEWQASTRKTMELYSKVEWAQTYRTLTDARNDWNAAIFKD